MDGDFMIVGICTIDMNIYTANSLKEKRQVLKSLVERLRNRFNVSVAEVELNELWKSARLGAACVSNDGSHAREVLNSVVSFIEGDYRVEIVKVEMEIL